MQAGIRLYAVIPAQAGIQCFILVALCHPLDARVRGHDEFSFT